METKRIRISTENLILVEYLKKTLHLSNEQLWAEMIVHFFAAQKEKESVENNRNADHELLEAIHKDILLTLEYSLLMVKTNDRLPDKKDFTSMQRIVKGNSKYRDLIEQKVEEEIETFNHSQEKLQSFGFLRTQAFLYSGKVQAGWNRKNTGSDS